MSVFFQKAAGLDIPVAKFWSKFFAWIWKTSGCMIGNRRSTNQLRVSQDGK